MQVRRRDRPESRRVSSLSGNCLAEEGTDFQPEVGDNNPKTMQARMTLLRRYLASDALRHTVGDVPGAIDRILTGPNQLAYLGT